MLKSLRIKNFAIIDDIQIDFEKGFNVFTGETGAGKSIIVTALSYLFKGRSDSTLIRNGYDKAIIEGVFDIDDDSLKKELDNQDIEYDGELIVKRVIDKDNHNSIKLNQSSVTLNFLSDLLSPIKAVIMMILTNCLSLILLFLGVIHQETLLLYIGSLMFGSIYSVGAVGIPMLTRYFFGNENYARTYSVIGFLTNVGSASSLTLIGYLYDFTQSYQMVFIIALCFHLINLILLVVICLRYNGVGDK